MGKVEILSASAGSGKTYRLALNYIKTLLEEPNNYRHILAVTFTNKATDELKGRILEQLHLLAAGKQSDFDSDLQRQGYDFDKVRRQASLALGFILHDYNNFAVMTIDKFFQRIMRAFVKEIGVDLGFNLELNPDTLLEQAADRILDNVADNSDLHKWVEGYVGESISEEHSWDIRKELVELGSELFKEEYRNSAITADDKPELEALATASIRQTKQAMSRYKSAGSQFMELMGRHGIGVEDFTGGRSSGVGVAAEKASQGIIFKNVTSRMEAALNDGAWHPKSNRPANKAIDSLAPQFHSLLVEIIEARREYLKAAGDQYILAGHYREFALLADLRSRIDDLCNENDILPISDVTKLISELVRGNDAPFIYEKAGNRYDYFMIDEFQDTSTLQWNNFTPLLHNALSQSEGAPVLLVGDVKQSIYRWRGGDWSLLASGVEREFSDVTTEPLEVNRRSTREVVEFNNSLTEYACGAIASHLEEGLRKGCDEGYLTPALADHLAGLVTTAYKGHTQKVKEGAESGYVTVELYDKEYTIHPAIRRIEELQERGYKASDIAILVRTNKDAREIATEILKYKNNPERDPRYIFDVVTQEALAIKSSKAVQFAVATLTLATNPTHDVALALYNAYFNKPFTQPLSEQEGDFISSLALLHPEEAFNELLLHYPTLNIPEEVPFMQAFHSQIIDYTAHNIADTALFVKWWEEVGSTKSVTLPQLANAITIITIHKAKGLGFNAVVIPDCNWSLTPKLRSNVWIEPNTPLSERITKFPVKYKPSLTASSFSHSIYTEQTMAAIDALNALYVAITRAKRELHILSSQPSRQFANSMTIGRIIRDMAGVSESCRVVEYGTPQPYQPKREKSTEPSKFATYSPEGRVAVRYSHQRYDEKSCGEGFAPQDFGILMHKAMEQVETVDDIYRAVELQVAGSLIGQQEATELRRKIDEALTDKRVAEWFDGSWERIRRENEIIDRGSSWRPDRVMTRGEEAVVLDYKFGHEKSPKHRSQIEHYAELLGRMGYTTVRGYLWYITLGEVVEVK